MEATVYLLLHCYISNLILFFVHFHLLHAFCLVYSSCPMNISQHYQYYCSCDDEVYSLPPMKCFSNVDSLLSDSFFSSMLLKFHFLNNCIAEFLIAICQPYIIGIVSTHKLVQWDGRVLHCKETMVDGKRRTRATYRPPRQIHTYMQPFPTKLEESKGYALFYPPTRLLCVAKAQTYNLLHQCLAPAAGHRQLARYGRVVNADTIDSKSWRSVTYKRPWDSW